MNKKFTPKPNNIYWFIKPDPFGYLGFVRLPEGAALIIGGKTGMHLTGHNESWESKLQKITGNGYVAMDDARIVNVVTKEWKPIISAIDKYNLQQYYPAIDIEGF